MAELPTHMRPDRSFQGLILALQRYWADYGCVILQPYDMEVGAGTFHPATTLRALGPNRWDAAYVQPSRRPKDGRYGENPNRLQHYYQFQVILKPSPPDLQELYLKSLEAIGIDPAVHDIRFVEDDWESPTLGAWGLGWECWCDGMEVSQFTYFQQVAGFECAPVAGELTYGLERLACYLQGVDHIMDLNFNGRDDNRKVLYRDVFLQAEQEYSRHNFHFADTDMLFEQFRMAEAACRKYLDAGWDDGGRERHLMALPAYDQCIKASHVFNLLDARGVISVTERQSYILRVRELAKACGEAWLKTAGGGTLLPPPEGGGSGGGCGRVNEASVNYAVTVRGPPPQPSPFRGRGRTRSHLSFQPRPLFSLSRLRGRVGEGAADAALSHRRFPLPNPPPQAGEGAGRDARSPVRTVLRGNSGAHAGACGGGFEEARHRPAGRCRPRL